MLAASLYSPTGTVLFRVSFMLVYHTWGGSNADREWGQCKTMHYFVAHICCMKVRHHFHKSHLKGAATSLQATRQWNMKARIGAVVFLLHGKAWYCSPKVDTAVQPGECTGNMLCHIQLLNAVLFLERAPHPMICHMLQHTINLCIWL